MSEYDRIFQSISDDIASKNKDDHAAMLKCDRVLNDIVRPAIRDLAASKLKPGHVKCNEEELSIIVQKSEKEFDEIVFICVGEELRIASFINSKTSETHTTNLDIVSSSFVSKRIEDFLRKSLQAPTSKDR